MHARAACSTFCGDKKTAQSHAKDDGRCLARRELGRQLRPAGGVISGSAWGQFLAFGAALLGLQFVASSIPTDPQIEVPGAYATRTLLLVPLWVPRGLGWSWGHPVGYWVPDQVTLFIPKQLKYSQ